MKTEKNTIENDIKIEKIIGADTIMNLGGTSAETNLNTLIEDNRDSSKVTEIEKSEENVSFNVKCKKSTFASSEYNLCTECNNEEGYFHLNMHRFKKCYNNSTKPISLYLDSDKKYKPCFETCLTCKKGGNEYANNCILCAYRHIKRPETLGTANCVSECPFGYYLKSNQRNLITY